MDVGESFKKVYEGEGPSYKQEVPLSDQARDVDPPLYIKFMVNNTALADSVIPEVEEYAGEVTVMVPGVVPVTAKEGNPELLVND